METSSDLIFNWVSMSYVFVGPSIKDLLGYDREMILEKGHNFILALIHPADFQKFNEVHSAIFDYWNAAPVKQRTKLRFSYNYRLKTVEGFYIQILNQSTFTGFTEDGKPIIEFTNITDITGFRKSSDIILNVFQVSINGHYILCHEHRFSEKSDELSNRERQVLELVRIGYTTKEIASKLYLSIETVKSHRKNIIAKTGAVNMTAATNMFLSSALSE